MMMQPNKQNQMQRDPSGMDQNRDRPSSPASGENAPSPSKRQRIDGGAPFNPNQPGMVANGRPAQGMPGQQMANNPNMAAAQQMLAANGINPNSLNPQQLQNFVNAPPAAQQKSIATYSQNLQAHHGTQMGNKQQMPNAGGPQNQGSPMMGPGPDGTALNAFYNPTGEMGGPGGIRPGPGGAQAAAGSNHALQDYQMQLMLLEQQNKKRLMMARQEQDTITGMPARDGAGPGAPGQPGQGPNGQPFPEASPQAMRSGASPNPADQMKRGTPQMNNSGIPSPVPEGGQSRDSPNPAMNFMGNQVDPNMAPHFFKPGTDMTQAQMNGMRPPSSHPGQPFNSQMNPQQMMAARQMQGQQGQQPGQGAPGQWQQGPNGQPPQGMQQNQQVQGTPQPRPMGPPSAPAATANANSRTTASPQQAAAAPPTPSQGNKPAPKKKETKAAKEKVKDTPVPRSTHFPLLFFFFFFCSETNIYTACRCRKEGQSKCQCCRSCYSRGELGRDRGYTSDAYYFDQLGIQQECAQRSCWRQCAGYHGRDCPHCSSCCAASSSSTCAASDPWRSKSKRNDGQFWQYCKFAKEYCIHLASH